MALIERYHVVAAERAVASGETIKEGQIVSLNSSGEVVLQSSTNTIPYGVAGDTKSTSASAMPGVLEMPNQRCCVENRRSASISTVLMPEKAHVMAQLAAVRDVPSLFSELIKRIVVERFIWGTSRLSSRRWYAYASGHSSGRKKRSRDRCSPSTSCFR